MTVVREPQNKRRKLSKLSMDNMKLMKEFLARAKFRTLNVKYHGIKITEQEINRRVLNGLPPAYVP